MLSLLKDLTSWCKGRQFSLSSKWQFPHIGWQLFPFLSFPVFRKALLVHFLKEPAKCSQILKSQNLTDFLRTLARIKQQALGFRIHAFMNDTQRRRKPVKGKEIGNGLGRTTQHISIILHLLLLLKMTVNQHIKLTNHIKRVLTPRVYIKHFTGYAGTSDEFETVRQYTLPEDYDIESEIMSAHQRSGIGNLRIREYMGWYYQVPEDFGQMLYMSQVLQARAMRIAMETHRRHMPYCMGSLVWQLNDCWPVASWSTTDYYHNWKAAQYALREACKPVILAPQLTADSLKLWVVNDLPTPLAGTYTLEIKGFDGKLHQTRQGKYKIKANEAAPIAASSIAGLLQDNSHRETMAVITIRQGKKIVDRQNVYFALPKELLLRQPDIQIQISEEQGKKYLTATTDRLACDVMFYLPGVKAVFTDNYKDLLPGHPFRTEIRTPLSKEEIEQQIRCRWVGK